MRRAMALALTTAMACKEPAPRVVLVVVDTLRADHLGIHGYGRATSPALDAWAADASVFEAARSPAPWTLPAGRALLGAGSVEQWDPGDTVATRLSAAGWRTEAVLANPNLGPEAGFDMGWDSAVLHEGAPADEQLARALEVLQRAPESQPTFLLLHFMDPHLPYTESDRYRTRWAGPAPTARLAAGTGPNELHRPVPPLDAAEREWIAARYDQNIRAVDDSFSVLLEHLRPADTLFFTADHGEALGEEGIVGHGHGLSETQVRIPLVVGGPGWAATRRSDDVGLDDVGATILAIAGTDRPRNATGRDLRSALPERATRLSHTRTGPARIGWVSGRRKWVGTAVEVQHLDLAADPSESAPRPDSWATAEVAQWAGTGAPPLQPAWVVSLAPATEGATQQSQPGVQSVTLTHPADIAGLDLPVRLRRTSTPTLQPVPNGWKASATGALPRELWFRPAGPVSGIRDAALAVMLRGEMLEGRSIPGVDLAAGMAPRWPDAASAGGNPGALEALGYRTPD